MGDYVPCVCVIWMHWAKSSWCSQVGPIMFCQCRCIILWKVLITVHWVVRLFNWFIELQQAWAVLVDSYLPLLRECILFHQNGIQRSHKWGTRLPCPILVYWLKVLRYLCSVDQLGCQFHTCVLVEGAESWAQCDQSRLPVGGTEFILHSVVPT